MNEHAFDVGCAHCVYASANAAAPQWSHAELTDIKHGPGGLTDIWRANKIERADRLADAVEALGVEDIERLNLSRNDEGACTSEYACGYGDHRPQCVWFKLAAALAAYRETTK